MTRQIAILLAVVVAVQNPITVTAAGESPLPPTLQPAPDPNLADPARTYDLCLDLARVRPDKGIELAGKWIALGGGDPAKHCQAIALVGLKAYGEAASRLETLAAQSRAEAGIRAGMLAQAGQAWLLKGEPTRAYAAVTAALGIVPLKTSQHAALLVDRAVTLAEGEKYQDAITDLNAALEIESENADALAFRASAHRHMDAIDAALIDAEHAVKVDSKNVTALLERGAIYRAKNRLAEARQDWIKVVELAPDSDAANAARDSIERLDFKPDGAAKTE